MALNLAAAFNGFPLFPVLAFSVESLSMLIVLQKDFEASVGQFQEK